MNKKSNNLATKIAGLGLAATLGLGCVTMTREQRREDAYRRARSIAEVISGTEPITSADIANITTQTAHDYTFSKVREAAQLYSELDNVERENVDLRKRELAQYVQNGLRLAEGDLYFHLNCVRGEGADERYVGIIVKAPERVAGKRTLDELANLLAPLTGADSSADALFDAKSVMKLVANAQKRYQHFGRGEVAGMDEASEYGYVGLGNKDAVGRVIAHFGDLPYSNEAGEAAGHNFTLEAHQMLSTSEQGASYNELGPVLSGQLVIEEEPRGYRSR